MKRPMILSISIITSLFGSEQFVGPAGELALQLKEQTPENIATRCAATNSKEDILINGQVINPFEMCVTLQGLPIEATPPVTAAVASETVPMSAQQMLTSQESLPEEAEQANQLPVEAEGATAPSDEQQFEPEFAQMMQDPAFQSELEELQMLTQDPAVQREMEEALKDPEFLKFLESFATKTEQMQ